MFYKWTDVVWPQVSRWRILVYTKDTQRRTTDKNKINQKMLCEMRSSSNTLFEWQILWARVWSSVVTFIFRFDGNGTEFRGGDNRRRRRNGYTPRSSHRMQPTSHNQCPLVVGVSIDAIMKSRQLPDVINYSIANALIDSHTKSQWRAAAGIPFIH